MGKKDGRLNEIGVNKNGEEMTIVRYGGVNDIDVQFVKDGTIVEHKQYGNFKTGSISNPFSPTIYGVGCIGVGKFKSRDENGKHTKCYEVWLSMLRRCYDPNTHKKQPTYKGCIVCEEWHNFQVFAQWFYEHYYELENERMTLDKDILCKGNKVYSPETCVFTPNFINVLFTKCNKTRGNLPIGVSKKGDKFQAHLNKDNRKIHLGMFNTPEEAFQTYKKAKEQYIKELAEKYKSQIPYELYEALMNYEVNIDD